MKSLKFAAVFILIIVFAACNFTEEIYLNDDGSGKLSINFDANELMSMTGELDTVQYEKTIDTTMVFKKFLEEMKDSIAQLSPEEQTKLKRLEPFSMHMIMNSKEQIMNFELFSEFEDISKVNDAFNAFQSASSLGANPNLTGGQVMPMKTEEPTTKVDYKFSENKFSRTTKIINQELFEQKIDSLASTEMFLSGSTYTFKYHFPRKVKKVNVEGATFSIDGKTMIYEVNFLDMMKTPEAINLEVELVD